jgi:hypothetical protein
MKESTNRRFAALLSAALAATPASAAGAAPNLTARVEVSSAAVKPPPIDFNFGYRKAEGAHERGSVGVGAGMKEGKPLEILYWGGAGAVAGSLAGPLGTVVGAAAGAVTGLLVSLFAAPRAAAGR